MGPRAVRYCSDTYERIVWYDKDYKSQIVIEVLGKCSKTQKSKYGIVAYSFLSRYSLFVIRVSCLDFNTIIPYYMFLGPYSWMAKL